MPLLIKMQDFHHIGVDILDEQHKGMISIVNTLHYLIGHHQEQDTSVTVAELMHNYFIVHFLVEESFLKKAEYPNYELHKEEHQQIIKKLKKVKQACRNHSGAGHLLVMLKEQWVEHFLNKDLKFTRYLEEKGISF